MSMFLSIYHNQSGDEYIRRLGPRESEDLRDTKKSNGFSCWSSEPFYLEIVE